MKKLIAVLVMAIIAVTAAAIGFKDTPRKVFCQVVEWQFTQEEMQAVVSGWLKSRGSNVPLASMTYVYHFDEDKDIYGNERKERFIFQVWAKEPNE